jgi:putative transposase
MKRVRYFTDGAVMGSKEFANEAFASARERFFREEKGRSKKDVRSGMVVAGTLWRLRDLRVGIENVNLAFLKIRYWNFWKCYE